MARVAVELPAVLVPMFDGQDVFEVDAGSTLASAFEAIRSDFPRLGSHLFDESGALREHVLLFHNDVNSRWLPSLDDVLLTDGDRLRVMQAVSGG